MWIEKQKSGHYKFVEQCYDTRRGLRKRFAVTLAKNNQQTRKRAQSVLNQRIQSYLAAPSLGKPCVTIAQLAKQWLSYYQKQVAIHTYQNAVSHVKLLVRLLRPETLISHLGTHQLNHYFDYLLNQLHYRNATVHVHRSTCQMLFAFAVEQEYLVNNPMKNIIIHYHHRERSWQPQEKFLNGNELELVINALYADSALYGHFCEFLYLSGLRYGEAASLYQDNVGQDSQGNYYVQVEGTLVYHHGFKKQSCPKTNASRRRTIIPRRAYQICQAEIKQHPSRQMVFLTANNCPVSESRVNKLLGQIKRQHHINKQVTLHTFRHTYVSKLAELKVPLYVIQKQVGHGDSAITRQIYLHVTAKVESVLAKKIQQL